MDDPNWRLVSPKKGRSQGHHNHSWQRNTKVWSSAKIPGHQQRSWVRGYTDEVETRKSSWSHEPTNPEWLEVSDWANQGRLQSKGWKNVKICQDDETSYSRIWQGRIHTNPQKPEYDGRQSVQASIIRRRKDQHELGDGSAKTPSIEEVPTFAI